MTAPYSWEHSRGVHQTLWQHTKRKGGSRKQRWSHSSNLTATKLETESKSPEFQSIHVIKATCKKSPDGTTFLQILSFCWRENIPKDGDFQFCSSRSHLEMFTFSALYTYCFEGSFWFRIPGNQTWDLLHPLVFWHRNSLESEKSVEVLLPFLAN